MGAMGPAVKPQEGWVGFCVGAQTSERLLFSAIAHGCGLLQVGVSCSEGVDCIFCVGAQTSERLLFNAMRRNARWLLRPRVLGLIFWIIRYAHWIPAYAGMTGDGFTWTPRSSRGVTEYIELKY